MNTYIARAQKSNDRDIANSSPKQQQSIGKPAFQLVDNRSEAIVQRKLQETMSNSPQVRQMNAYQAILRQKRGYSISSTMQLKRWLHTNGSLQEVGNPGNIRASKPDAPKLEEGDVWDDVTNEVIKVKSEAEKPVGEKAKADPIAEAAIDKDKAKVKQLVDVAMPKIRDQINLLSKEYEDISKSLQQDGRDWFVYAPLQSWKYKLGGLLNNWDESWTLEATSGLLMDIAIALTKVLPASILSQKLMNDHMKASRQDDKRVKKDSDWVKDLPEGAKVQAGVSASTATVLRVLRMLNVSTALEIEAVMNGLYHYWNNKGPGVSIGGRLKQWMGDFHTSSEIWAAYQFHLMEYCMPIRSKL